MGWYAAESNIQSSDTDPSLVAIRAQMDKQANAVQDGFGSPKEALLEFRDGHEQFMKVSTGRKYALALQAALRKENKFAWDQYRKVLFKGPMVEGNPKVISKPDARVEGAAKLNLRFPNINAAEEGKTAVKAGMKIILYYASDEAELIKILESGSGQEMSEFNGTFLYGTIPGTQLRETGTQAELLETTVSLPQGMRHDQLPTPGSVCAVRQRSWDNLLSKARMLHELGARVDEEAKHGYRKGLYDSGREEGLDVVRIVLGYARPDEKPMGLGELEEAFHDAFPETAGTINDILDGMGDNIDQKRALLGAIRDSRYGGLSIIKGPPGTGKSHW